MQKQIESIPAAAMRKLTDWHWPGNIRELQNVVERAVILTHSSSLAITAPESASSSGTLIPVRLNNFDERDKIVRILKETKARWRSERSRGSYGP